MAGILKSCGTRRNDSLISFLVVGPVELCGNISKGLHETAKERQWRITVHQCESVTEVTKSNLDLTIDFVIFAFDCRVSQSLLEVETNISLIDEHYIIFGTACLVNCNGASNFMGLTFHKARKIRSKYNLRFLSANVYNEQACIQLGGRILNLADAVLGITSGIPTIVSAIQCN